MTTSVGTGLQAIAPSRNTEETARGSDSLPLPASLARDFVARAACFRQADRDSLLAAPDPPARASAAELAALHFAQRPSKLVAARAAVPACHCDDLLGLPGFDPLPEQEPDMQPEPGCRRAMATVSGEPSPDGSH